MKKLTEFVTKYAIRGECCCGKCIDGVKDAESHQPDHSVNLTFFRVAAKEEATKEELLSIVKEEYPTLLDGEEHSYITVGADVGDQGLALMLIGLGAVLEAWKALTPELLPGIPDDLKQQMAGQGMISLIYKEEVKKIA